MTEQRVAGSYSQGQGGVRRLIDEISIYAGQAERGWQGSARFVLHISDLYAYIRPRDMGDPRRFLKQMAGAPPVQLGTEGFRPELVDDHNPARHYVALLFVGFWLPYPLALLVLYAWEVAGFVRYHGQWSQADVRCGLVGLQHGKLVRRYGPTALPALIAAELAA